ncbi:sugar transporter [Thermoplasma volcanium GSS1]|uniref:Sugar transporter n=1 Tax=Thermoplasma volcanium (strain ATCC 51530 / DSM 4299 / JCM 9571 / NBRC 15438 / GSS1) TaxID=273116 RepID=Q97B64_THEVO|nr:MFS transporter [Thermoplasma volcanium]BAB59736.1 sugar transporter [Thermoplasma volcanium GSS1]
MHTIIATYLGWSLDAFDFFLITFVMLAIAKTFNVALIVVTLSITLTLSMRFIGSLFFGPIGDKYGRKITMIISLLFLAFFDTLVAFSPTITIFLILRALYGFGMGGEWGSGFALAMESLPAKARGWVSGLIQGGYPTGYLLAAVVYLAIYPRFGWRPMFFFAALPAIAVIYIMLTTRESPVYAEYKERASFKKTLTTIGKNWKLFVYLSILLIGMNFVSHSTQDLYPTFLEHQLKFSPTYAASIAIAYNAAAIVGGILSGIISQNTRLGRKWNAVAFLAVGIVISPLWAFPQLFGHSSLIYMAFLAPVVMQFIVQGAWAMPGVYMNERSPAEARATIPGVAYMVGVMVTSTAASIEVAVSSMFSDNYSYSLLLLVLIVFPLTMVAWALGKESKNARLDVSSPS